MNTVDLPEELRTACLQAKSVASYMGAHKSLGAFMVEAQPDHQRLCVLSSFTADYLAHFIDVEAVKRNYLVRTTFAPFGQIEQQIVNPSSELYQADPSMVLILPRLEDLAPDLGLMYHGLTPDALDQRADELVARVARWVSQLRERSAAKIFCAQLTTPTYDPLGVAAENCDYPLSAALHKINRGMATACAQVSDCAVFDMPRMQRQLGMSQWFDKRLYYLGRVALSAKAQQYVGTQVARYCLASMRSPKKVLVLDADNTLWGGVIGEDGMDGIKLGEDYPGNVFKDFQRYVLSLRQRGIILALASKNEEHDVMQVLEGHPDCVLKREHFSSWRINWQDKATNMRAIADELNVGSDSLVFFDDNPVEREWVSSHAPEIYVVDTPKDPTGYIDALEAAEAFDTLFVSADDKKRADMYAAERQRQEMGHRSDSIEDFLAQLEMEAKIGPVDHDSEKRVTQLLHKTNQFNLTTRRHSSAELGEMLDTGAVGLWMRLKDKFGDNGLIGVAIAKPYEADTWEIDSFLLSCRVIGRGAEDLLLASLAEKVRKNGGKRLLGTYVPTKRNGLVQDFYQARDFHKVTQAENSWEFDLEQCDLKKPEHIKWEVL